MWAGKLWSQRDSPSKVDSRLAEEAEVQHRQAKAHLGLEAGRVEAGRVVKHRLCFNVAADGKEVFRQPSLKFLIVRPRSQRCFCMWDRSGESFDRFIRQREVRVGVDVIGIELQRTLVRSDRAIVLLKGTQRFAEVVVERRNARLERDRLLDQPDGVLVMARLMGQNAQQMQRARVARVAGKHVAVDALRFGKPASTVVLNRRFEELIVGR